MKLDKYLLDSVSIEISIETEPQHDTEQKGEKNFCLFSFSKLLL